ncbi:hypothetical protein FBU30_009238 [Linnemannia zychae]|nr:hypothetical protein FBU30_009238 [Linnemannia zychae]
MAAPIAVCSPPESKLFNNVRVLSGTPLPGSTGVRGRLYDVGTLCTEKVSDKIDRAWIAFLDCGGGCPLSTKLTNLQGSNPQAVLIYNQAACILNSPSPTDPSLLPVATASAPVAASPTLATAPPTQATAAPATPPASSPASSPVSSPAATPEQSSPPGPATTPDANIPEPAAPTQSEESNPNEDDEGDDDTNHNEKDENNGDDVDNEDDSNEGEDENTNDDGDSNEDSDDINDGENDGDNREESIRRHPRSFRTIKKSHSVSSVSNIGEQENGKKKTSSFAIISDMDQEDRSPRPRPPAHPRSELPVILSAATAVDLKKRIHRSNVVAIRHAASSDMFHLEKQQPVKTTGLSDIFVQYPVTIAVPEQITAEYLLKILTGPAASSPLPAPLNALKTTVNPNGASKGSSNYPSATADGNNGVITDLMVSISPAYPETLGEHKYMSMSKPIFGTVIGVLSVIVCGVILMYVVRPLIKRHQRMKGGEDCGSGSTTSGDDESENQVIPPLSSIHNQNGMNGYYGNSAINSGYNSHSTSESADNEECSKEAKISDTSGETNTHSRSQMAKESISLNTTTILAQESSVKEACSEKYTYDTVDSNSAPTVFDHSLSGDNTIPFAMSAAVLTSTTSEIAASPKAAPEDHNAAQMHLEILRQQDLPPLSVSTTTTPTAITPIAVDPTVSSYSSAIIENIRAASAASLAHNRINSNNVVVDAIPEESHHDFLEPAAPRGYSSNSGFSPTASSRLSNKSESDNENYEDDDDRVSVVSSRNGSDLFHVETKPRLFPTSIDTSYTNSGSSPAPNSSSSLIREGGLATALYRSHRRSQENTTAFTAAAQSPFSISNFYPRGNTTSATESNTTTPRVSASNDYLPSRLSMDSSSFRAHHIHDRSNDLQTRYNDLMSSSRGGSTSNTAPRSSMDNGGAPRASFSDEYRPRLPPTPTTRTDSGTPRVSLSNGLLGSSRTSLDSGQRNRQVGDIQSRFQEIASSSRGRFESGPASAITTTTPTSRASFMSETSRPRFSEDLPRSRPSLDALRANSSVTPTTLVGGELSSSLREQRASTANWSRYAKRDSFGSSAN